MAEPGPRPDAARETPPGMPRWVKIATIVVGVLLLAFLVLRLTGIAGEHGPGRHMSGLGPSPIGIAMDVSSTAVVGVG
jgi:cytochrome b561